MKGIITKAIGGFFFVADDAQNVHRTRIRGKIKEKVYPGDLVEFKEGMIEGLYPRKNLLHRPNIANVDQVLIVQSLAEPVLDKKLLDRFLVMVEAAGLVPLIVINKIDLMGEIDLVAGFKEYAAAGYQVYFISVKQGIGIESLINDLHERVNVLTGPSGVGKSSLINQFIAGVDLAVGEISPRLKRGTHTTRHVELLPINKGGWVADTPGFTSLDISHISPEELTFLFPEFIKHLDRCKFRVCSHTHEPGCAVKKAVEEGELSSSRYDSYQLFYQELLD